MQESTISNHRQPADLVDRSFGTMLRHQRQAQQVGLRELSRRVGMSPAYLSKIETDQFRPPAECKLVAIARELKLDPDAVIAQAGRIPADVVATIKQHPSEMVTLIRTARQLAENKNGQ
jgi:transcriptional regulator with XRE-family HTH domain